MNAGPFRRRTEVARRVEPPRRAEAPLRRPEPNLRRPDGVRTPTLAIDLGTAGTSAILVTPDGDLVVEDPDLAHPVWPSAVAWDGVAPRVGAAAESFGRVHPECHRAQLKQLLGEPGPVPLKDRTFRAPELVGWLFGGIRAHAQRVGGVDADRAVLTVPVSFQPGDRRRAALLDAATVAGFSTVELFYEPLAIMDAPLSGGAFAPGDMVLVCDAGAGGFTATLASVIKGGRVELLGYQEHPECSGGEIDRMIMGELLARAGRGWSDFTYTGDDPQQRARAARSRKALAEKARAVKHQLSSHASAIELIGPDEVPVELTAADLSALVAPVLMRAVETSRHVLTGAGVRVGELSAVLLTGGGSRIPAVVHAVEEVYNRPLRLTVDHQRAASEGAARFARTVERRHVRARVATDRETPLRWEFPEAHAFDLAWRIPEGSRFGASDPIATVRLGDGSLWELRAGRSGTLLRTHAPEGGTVAPGDWLVTVELDVRPFR